MKPPSDVVVGQYLQLICLCLAVAIAAVYAAGYVTGIAVHRLNDTFKDVFLSIVFSSRKSFSWL